MKKELFLFLVFLFWPGEVLAVSTSSWVVSSYKEFVRGELNRIGVKEEGIVFLSPTLRKVFSPESSENSVWAVAEDGKGNLYIGTGKEGRIYKISPRGEEEVFFDSPEINILSLTFDREGNLYAGSSPSGIIYRITPEGSPIQYYTTGESYVWSLLFDLQGNLWAGTGENGKIFRIRAKGEGEVVYDSPENHIMCLFRDKEGNLYAGGEGEGILYRIDPQGKVVALYDSEEGEIRSLLGDTKGNIYFISNFSRKAPSKNKAPRKIKGGTLYRWSPPGEVRSLWQFKEGPLFSLFIREGEILVGTGDEGKVFSLTPEGRKTLLLKVPSSQQVLFLGGRRKIYLGTGNPGVVYELSSSSEREGTLTSFTYDASRLSQWGKITWEADTPPGTKITFSVRCGNTRTPDDTWTPWCEEFSEEEALKLPSTRFIQWKARLHSSHGFTPFLKKVVVFYLPQNFPPHIKSLTIHPSTLEKLPFPPRQASFSERKAQSAQLKKGERVVEWKVEDPDKDTLSFTLYFKGEGEKNWKKFTKDIGTQGYVFDSLSLPDGWYRVKLVASDAPSNPLGRERKSELISEPFLIDNTPPRVEKIELYPQGGGKFKIKFILQDNLSRLKEGWYSLDGERWKPFLPRDGIFDSFREEAEITLSLLSPGEHTLAIKVQDRENNIGVGKEIFEVKEQRENGNQNRSS